jgi:hypothetical protein
MEMEFALCEVRNELLQVSVMDMSVGLNGQRSVTWRLNEWIGVISLNP